MYRTDLKLIFGALFKSTELAMRIVDFIFELAKISEKKVSYEQMIKIIEAEDADAPEKKSAKKKAAPKNPMQTKEAISTWIFSKAERSINTMAPAQMMRRGRKDKKSCIVVTLP